MNKEDNKKEREEQLKKEVAEMVNNINLQPLDKVTSWDTKRVLAYKTRIQKHISYLESHQFIIDSNHGPIDPKQYEIARQKVINYKAELKIILDKRENVKTKNKK